MQESNVVPLMPVPQGELQTPKQAETEETVSTHVLVGHDEVQKLRELSRRSRVAQSEYLREAVDDLPVKYDRLPTDE